MKRFLSLIIIFLFLPNLIKAQEYSEPKVWVYVGSFDFGFLYPPLLYVRLLPVAIGLPPPNGWGVGIAAAEGDFDWKTGGYAPSLPIYLYWVPFIYTDLDKNYLAALYTFFEFSNWAKNVAGGNGRYTRFGIGLSGFARYIGLSFSGAGFEAGYKSYKSRYENDSSLGLISQR